MLQLTRTSDPPSCHSLYHNGKQRLTLSHHTYTRTHARTHTHTHSDTSHIRTHTHTHTHMHTYTHTHTSLWSTSHINHNKTSRVPSESILLEGKFKTRFCSANTSSLFNFLNVALRAAFIAKSTWCNHLTHKPSIKRE